MWLFIKVTMGVIDDFKTEKNINLIFIAASKMIKDKYSEIETSDNDLLNIINSIKITICSDAVLIKKIVKLMELNKIALSKVKDHFDDMINKKYEPEIIEKNEDKIDNIKYDSEQLLLKVLELEEKRNAANSLANLQKETQEKKSESIIVSQPSNIDINLKIIEKLEAFSHTEYNNENFKSQEQIENFITTGKDLFGRDLQFKMLETFETLPQYLQQNTEKSNFKDYFFTK